MDDADRVRARAIFSGRVQGVGFRYTTVHVASGYAVTGYVLNQADGSVELVAEGERAEVESFVDSVSQRMARYVRGRDVTWRRATGEFNGFGARLGW